MTVWEHKMMIQVIIIMILLIAMVTGQKPPTKSAPDKSHPDKNLPKISPLGLLKKTMTAACIIMTSTGITMTVLGT